MARNLRVGIQRGLRQSIGGGFGTGDVFTLSPASFDFSRTKTKDDRITFSRASSGTYVGADGLIKTTPVNFALNSNTVQGSSIGTPIPNSTANVVSPRGIIEVVRQLGRDIPAGGAQIWRVGSTSGGTPNTTYTISFYAKTVNGGTTSINIDINDAAPFSGQQATITGEWTRIVKTGGSRPNNLRFFDMNMVTATADFYVWGAQIEIGTVATDYIPTGSTISGAPRFDHDPVTGESLGLLIEEAKTNILLKSEKMNEWIVGNGSSVTANQAVAPDGTYTADRVQHGSGGSSWIRQDVLTPGTTYTASVYAKAVTPGTNDQFTFDLGGLSSIFVATGEWKRFTYTGTASNASIYLNNGDDSFSTDVYFWGAQVEEGNFATSYIATDSSTVTRAADLAEIAGTNFSSFYNQSAGTFFGDITGPGGFGFIAHNGSNALRHGFAVATGTLFTTVSGISNHLGVAPTLIKNGGKFAYGYKANDYGAFGDGVNLPGTSPTAVPTGLIELALGYRGSFLANAFLNGHIKRLSYFPTRLADALLQSITS